MLRTCGKVNKRVSEICVHLFRNLKYVIVFFYVFV